MVFFKKEYYKEEFKDILLHNTTMEGIEYEECIFNSNTYLECIFLDCTFINCKFLDCSISACMFTNSRVVDTKFVNSKVIGIDWTKVDSVRGISFKKCKLDYSNFKMMILKKIKIVDCEAKEVDFTETDMREGIFTNTDFERSIFNRSNLSKGDFRNSKNYSIDARYNTIKNAQFSLPEALSLLKSLEIKIED